MKKKLTRIEAIVLDYIVRNVNDEPEVQFHVFQAKEIYDWIVKFNESVELYEVRDVLARIRDKLSIDIQEESPPDHEYIYVVRLHLDNISKYRELLLSMQLGFIEDDAFIDFNDFTCEIKLNGNVIIATPQADGENYKVFKYLFENPNKKFTSLELKNSLGLTEPKPLHKIVENLNFKGELKKRFFQVTKDTIIFQNRTIPKDS